MILMKKYNQFKIMPLQGEIKEGEGEGQIAFKKYTLNRNITNYEWPILY